MKIQEILATPDEYRIESQRVEVCYPAGGAPPYVSETYVVCSGSPKTEVELNLSWLGKTIPHVSAADNHGQLPQCRCERLSTDDTFRTKVKVNLGNRTPRPDERKEITLKYEIPLEQYGKLEIRGDKLGPQMAVVVFHVPEGRLSAFHGFKVHQGGQNQPIVPDIRQEKSGGYHICTWSSDSVREDESFRFSWQLALHGGASR